MAGFLALLGQELKYNGGLDVISREERSRGPNPRPEMCWGRKVLPGGEVPPYIWSFARHPGLSALMTLCTWPIVFALLMSV